MKATAVETSMEAAAVESTASEASMKATTVEAASATAVETTASAKAASVTTAAGAASVTATTTAAASGRHSWLNQADCRQCEQGYNRFPHHASSLGTMSLTSDRTLSQRDYSAIERASAVNRP